MNATNLGVSGGGQEGRQRSQSACSPPPRVDQPRENWSPSTKWKGLRVEGVFSSGEPPLAKPNRRTGFRQMNGGGVNHRAAELVPSARGLAPLTAMPVSFLSASFSSCRVSPSILAPCRSFNCSAHFRTVP